MKNIFKKSIYLLATATILLFGLGNDCFSQTYPSAPETLQEVKEIGEKIVQKAPESLKETSGEAISIWERSWGTSKYWIKLVWDKTYLFLNTEVEKRRPEAQKEFDRELKELKEEVSEKAPTIWDRFINLFR